jgi:hypothetical protein
MKLERIRIENFRGIDHLELDFQDELGRVQDVVPVVGPNTTGKTTLLDAITLCLGPGTDIWTMRPDLVYSPRSLVRRDAVRARVTCWMRFSDAEIAATREAYERTGDPDASQIPSAKQVTVVWEYPDPRGQHERGLNHYDPPLSYLLFKGRAHNVRSRYVPGVSADKLRNLGGVFMFDQKRTGLGQRVRRLPREAAGEPGMGTPTPDPFRILVDLATRAQAPQEEGASQQDEYERLRELFARVCAPHRLKGLYNTKTELDLEFEGPNGLYFWSGLSSGQIMLLMLLLQFARNRIHSSIVLIDELELHLHPLWQSRLYQSLRDLGVDNQIFFTTHSLHLRELMQGTFFHCTGELGDEAVRKVEG